MNAVNGQEDSDPTGVILDADLSGSALPGAACHTQDENEDGSDKTSSNDALNAVASPISYQETLISADVCVDGLQSKLASADKLPSLNGQRSISSPTNSSPGRRSSVDMGSVLLMRYRLDKILGEGGFGVVYEAADLKENFKRVAIKMLRRSIADYEQAVKRFEREIIFSQSIQSEHAVKIFDSGATEDERLFFVMEFLNGKTLDDMIERRERFSLNDTKHILLQILCSLSEAHDLGIIHRDMKPSNIFLLEGASNGEPYAVKVLDFGIAKTLDSDESNPNAERLTQTGAWMGSPAYMSPEQLMGRPVTPASDIFSLGIIASEMLTGRFTFEGSTPMEVAVQQMALEAIPIDDWIEETSLGPILRKCVAKSPADRFAHARELRDALLTVPDDALKNEYVSAKMRRFSASRKSAITPMLSRPSTPTFSGEGYMISQPSLQMAAEAVVQRRNQLLLILGIVVCAIILVVILFVKLYVDKLFDDDQITKTDDATSVAHAPQVPSFTPASQRDRSASRNTREGAFDSAALGAVMGAVDPPRSVWTITGSPKSAQVIRVEDGKVFGTLEEQAVIDLIRGNYRVNFKIQAEGYAEVPLIIDANQRQPQPVIITLQRSGRPPGIDPTPTPPPTTTTQPGDGRSGSTRTPRDGRNTKPATTPARGGDHPIWTVD